MSFSNLPQQGSIPTVADVASLPLTGNTDGDQRVTLDTHSIYIWNQGTTSWDLVTSGSSGIISVNGDTGPSVVLDTDDITEGSSNLYFTNSRAKSAAVADMIVNGVVDVAPSQNAVYDALALKADDNTVVKSVNSQTPTAGNVSLTTSNISEGTNLYFTNSRAQSAITGSAPVSVSSGVVSMHVADSSHDGYLSQTDWTTFNNKLSSGTTWLLNGNASTTPGTNFIGTSDAQNLIVKTNGINRLVFGTDGSILSSQIAIPNDSISLKQYDFSTSVEPNTNTTTANNLGLNSSLIFDVNNNGNDYGGTLQTNYFRFENRGSGHVNYSSISDNSAFFDSVAGITDLVKANNLDVQVGTGYTITSYNGVNSYLAANGSTITSLNLHSSNGNLVALSSDGVFNHNDNLTLSGSSSVNGTITGLNENITLQNTSNALYSTISSLNLTLQNTSSINTITGEQINIQLTDSSTNSSGLNGSSASIDVRDTSNASNINVFNGNLQVRNGATASGSNVANFYASTADTGNISSLSLINTNSNIGGSSVIGGFNTASLFTNIENSANITNVTGLVIGPNIKDNATVTNFSPLQVNAQVLNSATITNGVTVANFNISTTPTIPSVTGLSVDVTNANVTDPLNKRSISAGGGGAEIGYNFTLPGSKTFFQTHYMGGAPTIASGDPSAAFGFGTNLAQSVTFNDDWGPDGSGLRLGFNNVGFVGSIVGASGKTMDTWCGALGGAGNPSGSGTLDQAIMFRAAGILPQGGSLTVNNIYGFYAGSTLSASSPTNSWGVWVGDSASDNYFAKNVVIGGVTGKSATSKALDVTGSALISGDILTKTSLSLEDPGVGTNKLILQAPTLSSDWTLTLPIDAGSNDYVLTTNGSGVTSWTTKALSVSSGITLSDNTSSPTNILTYAKTNNFAIFEYSIKRDTNYQTGRLFITNDGTNASISGDLDEIGSCGITLSVSISGSNVALKYTSTNTGFNAEFKYFNKLWS